MNTNQSLWYFEEVDFVNLFCPQKIVELGHQLKHKTFRKGDFIYFIDEPSDFMYIIREGRVKIGSYAEDGREIVKVILAPGQIFGEMALAGEEKHNDYAQALDDNTTICPMTIEAMKMRMAEDQELSLSIFKLVGSRMRKLERRIESLVFKDARTRIIDFIRELAEERGQKVGFETLVKNHLKHQDIAALTGTSRQTVTTILNDLKEKNLINFDRRKILIRDMEKLR
jgi:CRP/FNR family transcriptional regulator, cyclic AMP receptor protein